MPPSNPRPLSVEWSRASTATRLLLGASSGLLLCLAHGYAPVLAPVAPVPLIAALHRGSQRQAFYVGLLCGLIEAFVLAGVMHAGLALFVAVCLEYALFRALFSLGVTTSHTLWTAPAWWVLCEWLHSHVPYCLPNLLGDTQHGGPLLPLARIGGTYLVACVLLWMAVGLWAAVTATLADPSERPRQKRAAMVALLGCGLFYGGVMVWSQATTPATSDSLRINVIQGGLPTWLYQQAEQNEAWRKVPEAVYTKLTREAPHVELTVWPETSVWSIFGDDSSFEARLRALQIESGAALLAGLPRRDSGGTGFNSGVLIDGDTTLFGNKRRLVIQAESHFAPGTAPPLLRWERATLGLVFCLESVVPHYARDLAADGAQALVVMADGSRFGTTPVARMHAQRSVIRAVESGRSIIHAGQHGFSTLIAPTGAALDLAEPFYALIQSGEVALSHDVTPYVRLGDWVPYAAAIVLVGVYGTFLLRALRRRKRQTTANTAA